MSGLHKRLIRLLDEIEIPHTEEVCVGPYSMDCFSYKYWLGFEADGPHHKIQAKRDEIRDKEIMEQCQIPILRLNAQPLGYPAKAQSVVLEFVGRWAETAPERRQRALLSVYWGSGEKIGS